MCLSYTHAFDSVIKYVPTREHTHAWEACSYLENKVRHFFVHVIYSDCFAVVRVFHFLDFHHLTYFQQYVVWASFPVSDNEAIFLRGILSAVHAVTWGWHSGSVGLKSLPPSLMTCCSPEPQERTDFPKVSSDFQVSTAAH